MPGGLANARACRAGALCLLLAFTVGVAGCSGDDGSVISDPSSSTPAPTTTAPTPSIDPTSGGSDPASRLREAQKAASAAYLAAVAKPGSPGRVEALLGWYLPGSQGRTAMAKRMQQLANQHFAARLGPKGYQVIESVSVNASGSRGSVTACTFDDGVLYDTRHADSKGHPVVVNDNVSSRRTVTKWRHRNGKWQQTVATEIRSWPDGNHCPAKEDD